MIKFVIQTSEDGESLNVFLNEFSVGHANHDDDGWAGMGLLEEVVNRIAVVLNAEVINTYGDGK